MSALPAMRLISVVTPSLNQASFLGEAVRSVLEQTYPDIEQLVLDGGSNDGSRELLERLARGCGERRFWWRSSQDGGQSAALNDGFARAAGDIVGWLNADDRYRPDCLMHVAKFFAQHPDIDVAYGDYTLVDVAGKHLSLRRETEFNRFVLRYHRVLHIQTTATFFRKRVFDEGNFLSTSLHYAMDLEFFLRLAEAGYRFQHIPYVLADFRIHAASKSVAFRERQRAEHRSVVLERTPLARHFRSTRMRNIAAGLLSVPAAALRYAEKMTRGYYFPFDALGDEAPSTAPQERK